MPRKPLIRSKTLPYHVTSRTNNKEWFSLKLSEVWKIAQRTLKEASHVHPVSVVSFVLMNNHYHLILHTPEGNLDKFMYEFNKRFALEIKRRSGHINHIFGGRYKWCLIESQKYYMNCYRYVYQNPIRAGLVERCEEYPYSSLRSLVSVEPFSVPLHDSFGFKDLYVLNWLNEAIKDEDKEDLRKKLARSVLS